MEATRDHKKSLPTSSAQHDVLLAKVNVETFERLKGGL